MSKHGHCNEILDRALLTEEDYLAAAKAASTRAEYAKDLKYYIEDGGSFPATVNQVVAYITSMATSLAVATIEKRLVSLHVAHLEQGYPSPVHDPRIKQLMQGVRRSLGVAQRQVQAIEKSLLLDMWSAANKGRPMQAARTTALLAIGWAGAFRRSELVSLTWESVTWLDSGIEITLLASKVDQAGVGFVKFIPLAYGDRCPVRALKHWQEVSGDSTGYIFRAINRHDQIADKPLTPHAVAHIVKRIIEQTGRDPELYSGHSLRAGFATAGTLAGIPSYQLMQVTGHKSEATLQKYVRIGKRRQIPSLL
ncbi:MAG: site-specific integrase [Rhodocyclales bacterium]|nr:site-specific integrase [Rhodocyclales bacterium]